MKPSNIKDHLIIRLSKSLVSGIRNRKEITFAQQRERFNRQQYWMNPEWIEWKPPLTDCAETEVEAAELLRLRGGYEVEGVLLEELRGRGQQLLSLSLATLTTPPTVTQRLLHCQQTFLPLVIHKSLAGPSDDDDYKLKSYKSWNSYFKHIRSICTNIK